MYHAAVLQQHSDKHMILVSIIGAFSLKDAQALILVQVCLYSRYIPYTNYRSVRKQKSRARVFRYFASGILVVSCVYNMRHIKMASVEKG